MVNIKTAILLLFIQWLRNPVFPLKEKIKIMVQVLAFLKSAFNLCFTNDNNIVRIISNLLSIFINLLLKKTVPPLLWITYTNALISSDQSVIYFFTYLNRAFMKAISTFVSLFLIVTICATSAILYLNENYNISAALCIVWIISLTLWIRSTALQMISENKNVTQNA